MELLRRLGNFQGFVKCHIHTSAICSSKGTRLWRKENGMPRNKTSEGPLTDTADYSFLDGRVTPLGTNQMKRVLKHREYARQIVQLCSEVDFAKKRYQDAITQKEEEMARITANRLKPKAHNLLKK